MVSTLGLAMEVVRAFLESSTIHGLTYLSTTRRFVRLFWILTVVAGFTAAGVLIYQSFENWSENPVTTTTETLPIKDVVFPKITVCPPKNTFTDLNNDLMKVDNTTIAFDSELFKELTNNFVEHFQNKDFNNAFNKITNFKEKGKYRNWYKKISVIPISLEYNSMDQEYAFHVSDNHIDSYALSGEVTTPYLGDKFDMDEFALNKKFSINIISPFVETMNLTLQFEYDIEDNQYAYLRIVCRYQHGNQNITDLNKKTQNKLKTMMIQEKCEINYQRHNPPLYFKKLKTKRFTGFNLKWKFCCSLNTRDKKKISDTKKANIFIKIAKMIHLNAVNISKHDLMNFVKGAKVEYQYDMRPSIITGNWDAAEKSLEILKVVEKKIQDKLALNESISGSSYPVYEHEISDETLATAAQILIYILAPQQKYWFEWYDAYEKWLGSLSLQRLLSI